MPSPIAHAVSGYALSRLFPLNSLKMSQRQARNWQTFSAIFIAIAADFDFIPQILTGEKYHRGLTHTLIFAVGLSFILAYGLRKFSHQPLFSWIFMLYGSHLILDLLTAGSLGIQLLWPFTDAYFKFPFVMFPAVHHSRGLFDLSHWVFVSWELGYSVLLLSGLWFWKNTQSRNLPN